jgi:CBS domain-containing protein
MLKASDVMTKDVATIRASATVAEAVTLMNTRGWSSLIVDRRNDQDAYGIITETDIVYKVLAEGKDPHQVRVYEVMTKPCITVNPDLSIIYVARLFADNDLAKAPVIQGGLLGIISITDLLTKTNFTEEPLPLLLEQDLEDAIAKARTVCAEQGVSSKDCRLAWEVADAIESELARHRPAKLTQSAFEAYCEEFPEVVNAQMWDNWCGG